MQCRFVCKSIVGAVGLGALLGYPEAAVAGNFIGDVHDDLVVGAPGETPGVSPRAGAAFLYRGASFNTRPELLIDQGGVSLDREGDRLGSAIAAGDFNGDGWDDLVIGAPGKTPSSGVRSGALIEYLGTGSGLRANWLIDPAWSGSSAENQLVGASLAVADFNGDGFDDVAAGAPGTSHGDAVSTGSVLLFFGSPFGLLTVQVIEQTGLDNNEAHDRFGAAVAAGDFDADGWADLAVGAPGESLDDEPSAGAVYIYRGSPTGVWAERVLDQSGLGFAEQGDELGSALAAGDLDGDGHADLAIGAPGEAPGPDPKSGAVFVYRGTVLGLTPAQALDQRGLDHNELGDRFGHALTTGDFNGDGRDELAIGAPGETLGQDPRSGAVYVFRGDLDRLVTLQMITQTGLGANEPEDNFGAALSSGNYVDDFRADLAIGAPGEAKGAVPPAGAVYLFAGAELGLTTNSVLDQIGLEVEEPGDMFGVSLE
jgi:hypothetical protein